MKMVEKLKIVLVGNGKVGKTSLLIRYKNDTFMDPNFVIYRGIYSDIEERNAVYRLHLADTSGGCDQIKFQYSQTAVFVLCFAINDRTSYNNIKNRWIPEIKPFMFNTPLILVGTKSDLKSERCIQQQQVRQFQKECNAAFYVECSAKDGSGVNEVIKAALSAYKRTKKPKKRFKCCIF